MGKMIDKLIDAVDRKVTGSTAEERAQAFVEGLDRRTQAVARVAAEARMQRTVDYLCEHLEEDEAAERAESEAWLAQARADDEARRQQGRQGPADAQPQ